MIKLSKFLVQVLVRVSALGHEVGIGACLESGRSCSETYTTLFNNKTTRRRKY